MEAEQFIPDRTFSNFHSWKLLKSPIRSRIQLIPISNCFSNRPISYTNLTLAVTNGKYYPTLNELGFLGDFEDLENVSEMVAETLEVSKDQQSESATGENNMCMCTCSEKCCTTRARAQFVI